MPSTAHIETAAIRHQVFLLRFAEGQNRRAQKTLNRLRRDIMARLLQEPTVFQKHRLEAVLYDIDQLMVASYGDIRGQVMSGQLELALSEAEFNQELFDRSTKANFILPSEQSLIDAVQNRPMVDVMRKGQTIEDALRDLNTKKREQVMQMIRDGVVLGDTTQTIAKTISTTMATLDARQLQTLVKTATIHTSSVARMQTMEANADILEGYEFVATLDSRTTLQCAKHDGEVHQKGQGPIPPLHWNCRSTIVPKVKPEYTIGGFVGKRPSIGAEGVKQVSGKTNYGSWLKKQPVEFVDEALGVERSRLFRSGKLSIDKFTDPTGRVYTLTELQRMNPFVFQEENLPSG